MTQEFHSSVHFTVSEFNWHLVEKQVVSCKKARRINEQCCFVPTKVKSQGLKKETIFDMVLFTLYKV